MCPLCQVSPLRSFQTNAFLRCENCHLILKTRELWPTLEAERARYQQHQNAPTNKGYLQFLEPVISLAMTEVPPGSRGLDYGSGPNPVLADELKRKGFEMTTYDPFFQPSEPTDVFFDFVTCTEAIEHFFEPRKELNRIFTLLRPKGVFILMTEQFQEGLTLKDWYYTRDTTHVMFYSPRTLAWIAGQFRKNLHFLNQRLVIFR